MKNEQDEELIRSSLPDFEIIGFIPEDDEIVSADRLGRRPYDRVENIPVQIKGSGRAL